MKFRRMFQTKRDPYFYSTHGKNGFAERSKILARIEIRKVILLNYQNNYIERSN